MGELARMAAAYGCDVSRPAATAHEAVQWFHLGYSAAAEPWTPTGPEDRAVRPNGRGPSASGGSGVTRRE
ncbi:hypothetical protein GCM10010515_54350 [Streptomyces fructofermentans]|uniref:PFL domain-containing protein n=1 Tax=Streptomyces fructofermentans TaxID=152141 RepID=A0A918NLX1_9ACTN|nr:hypothetical protein GCM10010515_54350 [Streptomyces fructofermentans]